MASHMPRRIIVNDLAYPVLLLQKHAFWIWLERLYDFRDQGLLIDRDGLSYKVIGLDDPLFLFVPRAERLRLMRQPPPLKAVLYHGEPVQLSLEDVRLRIVWVVSAAGHFERPQGLPSAVSLVESVEDLLKVLHSNGFGSFIGPRM